MPHRILILCLLVFVAPALQPTKLVAKDWPQFRGPGGLGVAEATGIPSHWSDTQNLVWKLKLPGRGASSPIALGDRLYLTCYSGYGTYPKKFGKMEDLKLHVVCVNRKDAAIEWETVVEPSLPEAETVRDHGYAAATPATDGKHVYVYFGKSGLFKFDLEGNQVWRAATGENTHPWGCGTSPVLYDDLVIVNASVESGALIAFHKSSGEEAWRASGMKQSWNTPHVVKNGKGRAELVVSIQGKLLAFDPRSGKELWHCEGIQDYVCPSVVSHDGVVYVIGGRASRAIAVRTGGRGNVTDSHRLWEAKAGANVSSPVIHNGHMYWVSDRNKRAYCLRLADGEIVHERDFEGQPYASATFADGKVFIVTRKSGTFVLRASPQFEQIAHNQLNDKSTFNASPIVAHDRLYLRSDTFLYAVGTKG